MSYTDDFLKGLEKRNVSVGSSGSKGSNAYTTEYLGGVQKRKKKKKKEEDIAPVLTTTTKKKTDDERNFFQKSEYFADGSWDKGDLTKTILGSATDLGEKLSTGFMGAGEKAIDFLSSFGAVMNRQTMNEAAQNELMFNAVTGKDTKNVLSNYDTWQKQVEKETAEFVKKDLYDEEKIAKKIISAPVKEHTGVDSETASVFAERSDELAVAAGDMVATKLVGTILGGPAGLLMTGSSSGGSEIEEALKQGATFNEAVASGMITASLSAGTGALFNGVKFGGETLTEGAIQKVASAISSKTLQTLTKWGINTVGEGAEEVVEDALASVGKKLTYLDEKEFNEIFSTEDAWESFLGGMILGGMFEGVDVATHKIKGTDYVTGLNKNEQKVVDKEVENRIAESEANGGSLTKKDKKKIYDDVIEDLDKGYINIDTIESALGGETYESYKALTEQEETLQNSFDELYKMKRGDMTTEQIDTLESLKQELGDFKSKSAKNQLKEKLSNEVFNLAKGSRLAESYNERARREQKFDADLSQYEGKAKEYVQEVINDSVGNNTRKFHDAVDLGAKLYADKGLKVKFATNEQIIQAIKEAEGDNYNAEAHEGKTHHGFITADRKTVYVNIKSPRYLNTTVGHEVTHSIKSDKKSYKDLTDFALNFAKMKYKDEYESLYKKYAEDYKGIYANDSDFQSKIEEEIVADIVGQYIFTDAEFINNLSTEKPNIFKRIYNEIKYLCKIATAGSKEARELEKVKREFDKIYRENGKAKGDTKYSLTAEQESYFKDSKVRDENGDLKVMYHGTSRGGHTVFNTYGSNYGLFGQGSYFTDDKSVAEFYTNKGYGDNKQVYETYLNITNPLDMDAQGNLEEWQKAFPDADFSDCNTNEEFYRAMEEYFEDEMYSKAEVGEIVMDAVTSMGYDGITHIGGGRVNADGTRHQVYIAFEPEQIKNIDNTKPTENADIRYSLSEDSEGNKLTEKQSEYFKDSKAVDRNGNLLKVYHTTKNDFTVFDKARKGEATEDANTYLGFFFTDDAEYMQNFPEFENGKTESYYLDMKNPIDMTDISREAFMDIVEVMGGDVGDASILFDEELEDAHKRAKLRGDNNVSLQLGHLLDELTGEFYYDDFIRELQPHYDELMSKGYDGVINYMDELFGVKEYIVLDSHQAKLTSNTNPTADADIRYSLSDSEGNPIDTARITDDESDVRYSLNHNSEIAKGQSDYIINHKAYVTEDELSEAQRVTNAMVDVMMKYSNILPEDKIGKVLTKNGSYDRSVENTTICVRTLAYNEFVDKVQEEIGRPLTQMESFLVSQKLYDIATEPQCLYCYVSLDRKAFNDMLLRYMQDRDTVIAKYNNSDKSPEAIDKLYEEFLNGRKDTKPMKERFNTWLGYVDNGTQLLSLADISTEDRQSVVKANGGILAEQLKDARKYAQSASWSKIQKNYVAYRDEILKLGDRVVKNLNEHYGLRWYSFSDYSPAFIVENMQQITDASIRGLKGLSYTKDTDYAEIFAPSGMNINISVFVNTDADGNFYIDEKQSANFERALELREKYSNVGIVATVTNDDALRWAGEQEWSDVIIPFHIVRTGMDVAEYYKWLNYTSESADTINDKDMWSAYLDSLNLKSENSRKKVSKNIYPNEHKNDKATYLSLCESRGLSPRFVRFAGEDWYMKLVNETRLSADVSSPLKPSYNLDAAQKSFQKFIDKGGYEGGWYKEGVDVDAEARIVADDVLEGKKANEVEYGRQDGFVPESLISKRKTNRNHGRSSLSREGEHPIRDYRYGNLYISGDDIKYSPTEDIAPTVSKTEQVAPMDVAKNTTTIPDEYAPTREFETIEPNPEELSAEEEQWAKNKMARADKSDAENKPTKRAELHHNIVEGIKTKFTEKGFDFDKVLKGAKNLSTFATVDNIPQRVMEKALGYKEGQILADETVNKVAQNESEGIKWLNSFTNRKSGLLAQISKQYGIKPGSKESAAAQMYAEGFYVNENNDIIEYGEKELAIDFPNVKVRENIKGLANDPRIRQIYDETLARINESRKRNGYPEIQRLDNYFLHFRAMEDTFSRLGLPFNPNDIRAKDLPTDLNGVTADLKPGQPYFASAMHRRGNRTSFDLLGGLERYLSSAKNQIYHIDDIQTLRALRNYIADTYGQAKGLESIDNLSEEEAQERIKQVYGSHLSTFAKFLNEEANVLAGKTTLIDRGLEGVIGRRGITFLDTVNKQVGSNMVGFNISSSLTNFLPVAQTFAKTNKFDFTKAFTQTVAHKVGSIFGKTDSFVENNPTIIRRKGAERFYRTPFQKVGDTGYLLMSAVDDISTELIVRTKYNELIRKGMDEQKASFETDKWVSRLMGDRSLGQQPQLYNSKMLGLFTKFQLEVRNQLDSQFYDTIQEAKVSNEEIENALLKNAKIAAKVGSTFVQLAVLQHLFGIAFESVAGYNPAFDIIEVLIKTIGFDDDEEDEDTILDNLEEGFLTLLEDLPYTSTLTGGRIPISSALPIKELVTGEDSYGGEVSRVDILKDVAPYYVLPTGYGQIKKSVKGLKMFDKDNIVSGSYTDSDDLRFPVEDNLKNRIQAGVFGQYANKNAREYFDNEYAPLKENQIKEYADVDMPIADYWKYREGLKDFEKQDDKVAYINGLDVTEEQKNVLKSYLYDEEGYKEENPEKYAFLESEGIGFLGYKELDEETQEAWSWAFNHQDEYRYFKENGVNPEDYSVYRVPMLDFDDEDDKAYEWAFDNPEKATLGKVFSSGVKEYKQYTNDLYNIKADKDSNGKSISGSRKEKVIDYINELDIDYGAKCILIKREYEAEDRYNDDIVDYLNSRDDISAEEMTTILEELGATIDDEGYIHW